MGGERSGPGGCRVGQRPAPLLVDRRRALGAGSAACSRHHPHRGRDRNPPLPPLRARPYRQPRGRLRRGLGAPRRRVLRDRPRAPGGVLILRRRLRPGHRRFHARRRRALPAHCGPESSGQSTGASTAGATTRRGRSRRSRPASATRSTSRRSRASSPTWWGERWNPIRCRSGSEDRRCSDEPAGHDPSGLGGLRDRDRAGVRRARLPDPQQLDAWRQQFRVVTDRRRPVRYRRR